MSARHYQTCPYCGFDMCEADYVDVGVGWVQCMPFYCDRCGACEIGAHDTDVPLTETEKKTGWYAPGRAGNTSAPTVGGIPVDHETALALYPLGALDSKK